MPTIHRVRADSARARPAEAAVTPPAAIGAEPPWVTILALGVLFALADGFWTTTLHTAVGDIGRIQRPFTSFWRTSALTVPLYVLVVLACFPAVRRGGGDGTARWAGVRPGLAAAGAATAVALAISAANALYDYHFQAGTLGMMASMQGECDSTCLRQQQWLTVSAHLRALAYTGGVVLVTNVVLVGWLVALCGGRLPLLGRAGRAGPRALADVLPVLVATALLAGAAVHAAVVLSPTGTGTAIGWSWAAIGAQALGAFAVLTLPRGRALYGTAAVLSLALSIGWTASALGAVAPSTGAAGVLAVVAAALLESGAVLGLVLLWSGAGSRSARRLSVHRTALLLVAIVAVGALGLLGAAPSWLDGVSSSVGPVAPTHR